MTRWKSTPEAHELRTLITGRIVAKVTPMVRMYRAHFWGRRGVRRSLVVLALISTPAMAGEIPPCVATMNCTEVWKSPGPDIKVEPAAIDACQADNERLSAINADLVTRVAALEKIIAAKKSEIPKSRKFPAAGKKRLPCKKGRTRNAQGICGRWG